MRRRIQHVAVAGLGLLALMALAACSRPSTVSLADGSDPRPSAGAASSPAVPSAAGSRKASGEGGTAAGHGSLASTAWARVLHPRHCTYSRRGERVQLGGVSFADVTGDGEEEAFVVASCLSSTSTNPQSLYVFDGASTPDDPRLLDTIQGPPGLMLRDLQVTIDVRVVHLRAEALSKDAPLCCPDRAFAQMLAWNGKRFDRLPPVVKPLAS
jgi:hypothetical protein